MATRNKNNPGITLAAVGGGALLLWLLWRGRGKGKAKGSDGDRRNPAAPITVWILPGDRLALDRPDGPSVDLATVVALGRVAGAADARPAGDARHGWVEQVQQTLEAAGAKVSVASPLRYGELTPRVPVSSSRSSFP
jgi:hypothetical protein